MKATAIANTTQFINNKIIETTDAIVLVLNVQMQVQLISKGALKTFGYNKKDLLGKNWFSTVVPTKKFPLLHKGYKQFLKSIEKTRIINAPVICKNQQQKIIAWQTSKIYDKKTLVGTIAFGKDITGLTQKVTELEADKKIFKNLADQISHPILVVDIEGNFIFLNKAFNKQFGYTLHQLHNVKDAINKSNLNSKERIAAIKKWETEIKHIFKTKKSFNDKIVVFTNGGNTKLVEYTAMLMDNYVYYVYTDITEQTQTQNQLQQAVETFKKIASHTPVAIAAYSIVNSKILFTNSYFSKSIGYTAAELNALNDWGDIIEYDSPQQKEQQLSEWENIKLELLSNKKLSAKTTERKLRCKNGKYKIFEVGMTLGNDILYAFFYDKTQQKNYELELINNEQIFRKLAEFSPYPIAFIKTNGTIIFLNKAFENQFELDIKNIVTLKDLFSLCYTTSQQQKLALSNWKKEVKLLNEQQQISSQQFSYFNKANKEIHIEYVATKYKDFIYYTYINTTAYHENKLLLQKANEAFAQIAQNTPIAILSINMTHQNISFANKRFYETLGYNEKEIIGNTKWLNYIQYNNLTEKKEAQERVKNLRKLGYDAIDFPRPFERSILCKNGSTKTFEIDVRKDGENLYVFLYDITERKKAEELIKQSETQFRTLAENMPIAIGAYDKNNNTIFVNEHFTYITGYNLQDVPTVESWYEKTQPNVDVRKAFYKYWQQAINDYLLYNEKSPSMIATSLCKNGKFKHFSYSFNVANDITYILLIDITEQEIAKKQLQKSHEELRTLNKHLNTIREEERKTISREIHDELGQQITGIKMAASSLFNKLKRQENIANQDCENIIEMLSHSVNTVRKISTNLRPSIIDDLGIAAAVEWLVNNFRKTSQITCITYINIKQKLSSAVKNNVFRIVQESLTNIARHAKATIVNVDFFEDGNKIFLIIADNGKGFDIDVSKNTLGVLGMRERTTILQGDFNIFSKKNNGTRIIISIPIEKAIE